MNTQTDSLPILTTADRQMLLILAKTATERARLQGDFWDATEQRLLTLVRQIDAHVEAGDPSRAEPQGKADCTCTKSGVLVKELHDKSCAIHAEPQGVVEPKQVRPIDDNMVRDFKVAFHEAADADPLKMNYEESVRRGLEAVVAGLVKVAVTDELVEQGRAAFARAGWKPVGKSTMRSALEAVLGVDPNRERRDQFAAAVDVSVYGPFEAFIASHDFKPTVAEFAEYIADIRRIEANALIRALDKQATHD